MAAQLLTALYVAGYSKAPSGSVRFYQVGTTVPVNVFNNDAASQVITQPVQLDANGIPTLPIYATAPVRAIIYDVNGAQLLDVERIDGTVAAATILANTQWPAEASVDAAFTALATSLGSTDGKFKSTGTGAVARTVQAKLAETPSVRDFGAVGNGIADDTGAFNAAIAAATSGGTTLRVPAGTYLVTSLITINSASNPVSIQGDGWGSSIIKNNNASAGVFALSGLSGVNVDGIQFIHSSTSTAAAISITSCANIGISRCRIAGHAFGVDVMDSATATVGVVVRECSISVTAVNGSRGIRLNGTVSGAGQHAVFGNQIGSASAAGTTAAVEILGNTTTVSILGNGQAPLSGVAAATGVLINSAHTGNNVFVLGNDFSGSSAAGLSILRATGFVFVDLGNSFGAVTNSSDGTNVISTSASASGAGGPTRPLGAQAAPLQNLTGSVHASIDLRKGSYFLLQSQTAAATITVDAPTGQPAVPPQGGNTFTVSCKAASAGGATFTFAAAYVVSGTTVPTGSQRVNVTFVYDNNSVGYFEIGRVTLPS